MSMRKMAQFIIDKSSKSGARLGHLTLAAKENPSVEVQVDENVYPTPAFFIHTLGGSIPHITAEVLEYIFPSGDELSKPPVQISIDSTATCSEAVGNFGQGIASFVGLKSVPVFLTTHNPLSHLRTGYNDKSGIALWTRTGRVNVSPSKFEKIVGDYKPAVFQGLNDYDVSSESSIKRIKKSTTRAVEYLEEITKSGQHNGLFVTIESAWFSVDEQEANKTVGLILEKLDHITGFVLNGFGTTPIKVLKEDGKPKPIEVQNIDFELLKKILSKLPHDKPRYVPGPFNPHQILELVAQGVDLFDSSFLTKLADAGEVFLLDQLGRKGYFKKISPRKVNEELPKRDDSEDCEATTKEILDSLVSLKNKRFFNDFSPVSKYCSCYTCRKHTKAYINHLYATDELLGPVLIMIHNLTAFSQYFKIIRDDLREECEQDTGEVSRLDKLKQIV